MGQQTHSLGDSNILKLEAQMIFLQQQEKEEPGAREQVRSALGYSFSLPSLGLMEVILGRNLGCAANKTKVLLLHSEMKWKPNKIARVIWINELI